MVRPLLGSFLPEVMGKMKKPYPRFHRCCYKKLLKIDFYLYQYMIVNWKSRKFFWIAWKFQFLSNLQFLGSTILDISCLNLAQLWPRAKQFSPKYPSKVPLKCPADIRAYKNRSRLGDIDEDIGNGVQMTPGVYVDQKTLVFLWLYDNMLVAMFLGRRNFLAASPCWRHPPFCFRSSIQLWLSLPQ